MDMLGHLERQFAYDEWANRAAAASLRDAGKAAPSGALRLLSHIAGAESLWLDRLLAEPANLEVWPELGVEECDTHFIELSDLWRGYLEGLTAEKLAEVVSYKNSKGEPWSNSVEDVLMHVVIHSAYHRGQIAAAVRAAGHEPATTDYIHAVRQGLLE